MTFRLATLVFILPIAMGVSTLPAQDHRWTIGVAVGRGEVGGTSRDSSDSRGFRPHDLGTVSLTATLKVGALTVGLIGAYGKADFGLEGSDLLLVDKTTSFTVYEIAPVVGVRLTRLGHDGELGLVGGPVIDFWSLTNQPNRTRVGARIGLALPVWFGTHLGGVVRLDGVVTPSVFEDGELPSEFIRTATWRVQLSLGVLAGF